MKKANVANRDIKILF